MNDAVNQSRTDGEMKYSFMELFKKMIIILPVAFLIGAISAFLFIIKDLFL